MNDKASDWNLTVDAFLAWKRLGDAERRFSKAGDEERCERLRKLAAKAWRRYRRRWANAKRVELPVPDEKGNERQ